MKQISNAVIAFFAVFLILGTALPAICSEPYDESTRIFDMAGLFEDDTLAEMQELAEEIIRSHEIDAAVVTTNNTEGKSSLNYAISFYEGQALGVSPSRDGILMLINMDDREVYILTAGSVQTTFDDCEIESLLDTAYDFLSSGMYSSAANQFLTDVRDRYPELVSAKETTPSAGQAPAPSYESSRTQTEPQRVVRLSYLGRSFFRACFIAALAVLIMYLVHRQTLPPPTSHHHYMGGESVRLHEKQDRFVTTHTSRIQKQSNSSSGGGGGSRSGGGGKSSYGGGGRKF